MPDMKSPGNIFLAIFFVFLTAIGTTESAGDEKRPVSPFEIDKLDQTRAPEFQLKDLDGKSVSLASHKGKVVLLNFWATWCPSCSAEMPSFNRLYQEMKSRGLEIIAVSTDRSVQEVRGYLSKRPLDFKVLMDENRLVTRQYKVFSLPTTFLIDREGIIIEKFYGEYDWNDSEIKRKIEKLQ